MYYQVLNRWALSSAIALIIGAYFAVFWSANSDWCDFSDTKGAERAASLMFDEMNLKAKLKKIHGEGNFEFVVDSITDVPQIDEKYAVVSVKDAQSGYLYGAMKFNSGCIGQVEFNQIDSWLKD